MRFVDSFNFVWFCFGIIMAAANFVVLIIRNHIIKLNSPEEVEKSGIRKIKMPIINIALLATVSITNVIDFYFDTDLFVYDIILWFVGSLIYFDLRCFYKNPYKTMICWMIMFDLFWAVVFSIVIFNMIISKSYDTFVSRILLPMCLSAIILALVQTILIRYYRTLIKSIEFDDENVVLNTYHGKYVLPVKYFKEVKEDLGIKRTIIKYDDEIKKRTFIYPMIWLSPFKIRRLDIEEMQKRMPYAKFS
ncbi:MAG: hypothetical protein K6F76_04000 [Clostridiales bacterium]|nr:hypothetical protein [Clostridiales bacterium]